MEQYIQTAINWGIPIVLAGILAFMKKMINDNKSMKASILALIRSQIVSKCESYQKKGYLPEYARYCLEDLFKNYENLGGNHGIKTLVNKTFELPPVKKEEE